MRRASDIGIRSRKRNGSVQREEVRSMRVGRRLESYWRRKSSREEIGQKWTG